MTGQPAAQDIQAAFAAVMVDEWLRAGVTDAVVCPGSRSTPLLVALAERAEQGALRLHVLLDERSAAFFALGLGLASGVPAPVVTTSGTAAAELHPAVVEADQAGVPLLAVTADRPEELHDCGAPQTVRQVGLYGGSVRWQVSAGVPELATADWWRSLASRSVAEARGGAGRPGPVHVNLAFREPLLGSADVLLAGGVPGSMDRLLAGGLPGSAGGAGLVPVEAPGSEGALAATVRQGRPGGAPWHRVSPPRELEPAREVVDLLAQAGERGLIVAGPGAGNAGDVWALSQVTKWPVLADPISGCRVPGAVAAADTLLRTELVRGWRPDVVLRLGAPWASRVVNEWLGELDCLQVLVDRWGTFAAPDRLPGEIVVASPEAVCRQVARAVRASAQGAWARQWARAESVAQGAIDTALAAEVGMTEPGISRALVGAAPHGSTLVVSSSMPVRDVEWWSRPRRGLRVLANRGANGIDGVLSTALGVAAASLGGQPGPSGDGGPGGDRGPGGDGGGGGLGDGRAGGDGVAGADGRAGGDGVAGGDGRAAGDGGAAGLGGGGDGSGPDGRVMALLGDLAFLYDGGALLGAANRGFHLDVVVVDNDGGGIFNFLAQAAGQPPERFERLWGTPHGVDLCAVARSYGAEAEKVTDLPSLTAALGQPAKGHGVRALVAETDRAANVAVHRRLHQAVEAAVKALA